MSSQIKIAIAALAAAALAAITPALAIQTEPQGSKVQAPYQPSVLVFDQKAGSDGVIVKYAYSPADGYVVFHDAASDGTVGKKAVGHAPVKAGENHDIKVPLQGESKSGSQLWASLYLENNNDKTFDASDKPVWKMSELPLANMFTLK